MYYVDTDPKAQEQVDALPPAALSAYAEARTFLEVSPWEGRSYNRWNPDGPMRTVPFGEAGLIIYLVLDDQRRVDVLRVLWRL
ncbi:MAG: hypothetical protein GEU98_24960 [Pseudonocardiaceae bacterium]|nr:hypothetical protein [Pseudonocardiaceae bacterium]